MKVVVDAIEYLKDKLKVKPSLAMTNYVLELLTIMAIKGICYTSGEKKQVKRVLSLLIPGYTSRPVKRQRVEINEGTDGDTVKIKALYDRFDTAMREFFTKDKGYSSQFEGRDFRVHVSETMEKIIKEHDYLISQAAMESKKNLLELKSKFQG